MNIAFLFNSDHPSFCGYYGPPIMNLVLGAGVLQSETRSMRVSVGDILTLRAATQRGLRTHDDLEQLCRRVYVADAFRRLNMERLEGTFRTATVYCWLFQNMTSEIASLLDQKLASVDSYLGAMDVNFSKGLHLRLFRNSLIEKYRLTGRKCAVFYDKGLNEDLDMVEKDDFETHGFTVCYEDQGIRRTIFDNYDTLPHFKRVDSFKVFCATLPMLTADDASDLAHSLEELHPKLFDGFAAAARTLDRAETDEDCAQAALSGRRLLEQTADSLFPPRSIEWNGRKVGPAQYKNRLWAYVTEAVQASGTSSAGLISELGTEADRLVDLFNSGLHAKPTKEKVELAFRDLVIWLSVVINISPEMARDPYQPYSD